MIRRSYNAVINLSAGPYAPYWLAAIAFAESSFFPIPPDTLLLPMCLAQPRRAYLLAGLCTIASVLGGCFGYFIGAVLYQELALPLAHAYHFEAGFAEFQAKYAAYGAWVIIGKGLIPIIPYKLVSITAGIAHYNFLAFALLSIPVRASRFFLIAALLQRYGDPVREFVERRLALVTSVVAALIILGFVLIKFL